MTTTATTVKRQLLAARISQTRSLNNEAALKWELHKFFLNLKDKVLKELHEYYPDDTGILLEGHLDLILAPIFESQQKYYNILRRFNHKEYNFGVREAKRLVKLAHNNNFGANKSQNNVKLESLFDAGFEKDDLFATQKWSEETLLNHSFTASETTMNRVDKDINNILTDGYKSGKGIPHVRDQINKRFNQLADWEAQRIARTEIHNAHQMGIINTYNELGIQYVQWSSTHDTRTRGNKPSDKANHVELDGEIIPLGGTFSNGLEFPGDTKGPLREWINCRCSLIPFIIPDGYMAPSFSPFRESDLVPTLDLYNYDDIVAQATSEVKQAAFDEVRFQQLKTNEEIAEFFGYEYIPKGRYYEQANIKTFEFYDKKTDTILRFAREGEQKCLNIDFTNNGRCEYDLKEVLRIYDETHPNLKVGLDDITFLRGDRYTPGGDAARCSVRIYDSNISHNLSKRGIPAEVEPLEHTLDHELGHIFSESFLQEGEFNQMDDVALSIRKKFKKAGVKDNLHQQNKGLPPQKVSYYAEKNQSENFAEVTAGVSNLKRGNNYKVYAENVRRPDESRMSGFMRDKPTLKEVKSRNPNQYEFVDDLLDHPEKVMKNWKSINQKRVKESRDHFNEFLKQEQTVIRAKTKIKDYDKYALNEEQLSRYNELKGKKLKFLEKREFKQLEAQIRFNELHNQLLIDGKLERELEKEYNHLSNVLSDVLAKPVESKSTRSVFNDGNFFKLSESEKARRAELMQKTKDKTILPEEKAERRLLGERERIQDLHEKLLKEGLNESETGKYLDEYVRLKQHGMDLPEIPTNLKFTTPKPSFEKYNFSEVKIGNKYSLTKKESDELYELEKKQLLSEKAVIKDSLTEKELSRIKELQSQKEFNHLYYIRNGEGGLNYDSEMKYEKLVSQFKSKLKLSDDLIKKSPLPKYSNKVKSSNDKPLKLKGKNEEGLPPDHKIKDLFTIDVTEATANEQRVVTRWMGNDFTYFRDYTVRCKGNLDDYIEYVLNASEDQLKHYGYIKTLVQNGETENVIKEITQIAKSLDHDLPVLDNILNNNMTKKNMVFWRVEERHHLGDNPKPGDIVTFKGRNSTAITKEGAEHFAEVTNRTMEWTYEIEAPAGTRGAYVSHLNQSEKIRQEMEYLLAEDTQMEIITFNDKKKYAKLRIIVDEGATKSMFSYIINNIKKVLINV